MKIENKSDPSTANLGSCKELLLEGFDGGDQAILVLSLSKPLQIDGHKRTFAGVVIDEKQISQLATSLMRIAKKKARQISLTSGPKLVKPVHFV